MIGVVLGLVVGGAAQAVPVTFHHQGRLLGTDGTVISGQRLVEFSLYPSESATVPVWEEDLTVTLQDGFYAAVLGNLAPLDDALLASNLDLWLGVSIDGAPLTRTRLATVPYASLAGTSRTLSRTDCSMGQVLTFDGDSWECATVGGAIGDIQWSVLDEAAFQARHGAGWVKWVPRSIVGSDLHTLTGLTTLPDPTGHYLRAIGSDPRVALSTEGFATSAAGLSVSVASGGAHGHSASTTTAGSHGHSGSTGAAGDHTHTMGVNGTDTFSMAPGGATQRLSHFSSDGFGGGGPKSTNTAGSHSHSVSVSAAGDHTHGVTVDAAAAHTHTATVSSTATETRPRNVAAHLYIKIDD